jgi:hypothetical protein
MIEELKNRGSRRRFRKSTVSKSGIQNLRSNLARGSAASPSPSYKVGKNDTKKQISFAEDK